jgi:hypothetical protein
MGEISMIGLDLAKNVFQVHGIDAAGMVRKSLVAATLVGSLLAAAPSFAGVQIRFITPERYTDAGSFGATWRDATMAEFRAYFEKLGRRFLRPGQNLIIEVLNIDLAGHYEPWRRNLSDVRIMRDVTPPSFKLRYALTEKGKPRQSGEDTLTDINYQMNASARFSSDRYAYEKALLDDWFRRTFANRRPDQRRVF